MSDDDTPIFAAMVAEFGAAGTERGAAVMPQPQLVLPGQHYQCTGGELADRLLRVLSVDGDEVSLCTWPCTAQDERHTVARSALLGPDFRLARVPAAMGGPS